MAAPSEDPTLAPECGARWRCLGLLQHPAPPPASLQLLCQLPSKLGTCDSLLPRFWHPGSFPSLCIPAPPAWSGSCESSPTSVPPHLLHWLQPWPSPWHELVPTTQTSLVWKLATHPVGRCGVNAHIQGICCKSGYKMENTGIVCGNGHSLTSLSCQVE